MLEVKEESRIVALFTEALEVPARERSAWIERRCEDDPALRDELDSLLTAFERPGPLDDLERDVVGPLHEGLPGVPSAGERVGPYRLVRAVGSGGMGTVYLAERDEADFSQRVALKLVRPGPGAASLRDRFLGERRILATLEHPGIARFIDGGFTSPRLGEPEGQPYIVMEYVEGEPITAFADRRRLPVAERLRLFRRVCGAVHHAHRHLVVHRDLKPSNILVTADGVPKLVDFGVAKLMAGHADVAPLTRTGIRVLTPEYAAPELVCGDGVTTATDVYGLGAVLYELLSGCRPFELAARTAVDVERVICHTEPRRPSAVVLDPGTVMRSGEPVPRTSADVARDRSEAPDRLRRRLAGDLDVIVMRALAKEPSRRYASAAALSDDVGRHLAGLPVEARGDSRAYRFGRLVRRNRTGVAAAALVGASLVAGLIGTASQAARADRAAETARAEAAKANQVSALVVGLFEQADPEAAMGDTLTVFDLLDEGTRRVEADLADAPEVQASLLGVLGRSYLSMGSYEPARRLLTRADELQREGSAEDRVVALLDLGRVYRETSEYEAADSALGFALDLAERSALDDGEVVADVLETLAAAHGDRGDWRAAEGYYERALAARLASPDPGGAPITAALVGLADAAADRGDTHRADSLYAEALAAARSAHGSEHPEVGAILYHVGRNRLRRTDWRGAADRLEEALAIFRRVYGEDHRTTANTLIGLAVARQQTGAPAAADSLYDAVLASQRRLYGGDHVAVAHTLHNRALLAAELGRREDAIAFVSESLAMRERLLGPDHPFVMASHRVRSLVVQQVGTSGEADRAFAIALRESERIMGPDSGGLGALLYDRGRYLFEGGRTVEAEPVLRRAVAHLEVRFGAGHHQAALAETELGRTLVALGRFEEAERLLRAAHPRLVAAFGADDEITVRATQGLEELYDAWGRPAKAERHRPPTEDDTDR